MNYLYNYNKYIISEKDSQDKYFTDIALEYYHKVKKSLQNKEYGHIPSIGGYYILGEDIGHITKNLIIYFVHPSSDLLNNEMENFKANGFFTKSGNYYLLAFANLLEPNNDKYIDTRLNKSLFIHEFIHFLDKNRYDKSYKNTKFTDNDSYYNSPEEFNAFYQQESSSIRDFFLNNKEIDEKTKAKFLKTFEDFKKIAFRFFDKDFIENINTKYKNKLNKRLYKMYTYILNETD